SVQYGVWSHVAGVYNKQRKRIELYVNGVLAAEGAHAGGPNTTGEFQIGRAKWNGAHTNYFAGAVDDVLVYTRPLFAEEVRTLAGRDLTLVHNWALDEGAGSRTADSIGGRGATLSGGTGYTAGKLGNAVTLDGTDDSVSTDRVDLSTDRSFTVSSWIRLDSADCPGGECRKDAVSIDGGGAFSKMRLGHIQNGGSAPNGKWIFEMPEPDGTVTEAAVTRMPGEVGQWVFLTGVYDAPNRKIWLYVNANRIDDGTLQTPWKSTGGLAIGRGKVNNVAAAFWDGSVDDVRLYSAALDKDRITALHRSYPADAAVPNLPVADAGHWRFDENSGTTAADASGRARTATLRESAGWNGGRLGTSTWLTGTGAYLETDGPVLATSQSFSVTGWATLQKTTGGNRVVLAQDRTQVSAFMLMFDEATGKWAAAAPATDVGSPATQLVRSATPAVAGTWTHLGVVYDAQLHQMRLYVNGALSGVQTGVTILDSAGRFSIGRVRWNNNNGSFFPGGIDDVRAFGRALSDGEVRKVHDSATALIHGKWTYEGTPGDVSWLNNPATLTGGTSYVAGKTGQAIRFDGTSGTAVTQRPSVLPSDSFTVSAWVRLERADQDATALGQDGVRRSGFVLQYNKNVGRWVIGAPVQDADGADLAYAYSAAAPQLNTWTHLTAVYDNAGRQFRLYVNGVLSGVRNGVQVGPAGGSFTMGRGKINGVPAEFFAGALDEVQTDLGTPTDAEIRTRAGLPAQAGN
ncbi:MAG: LamG domain-containing protein, partial [Kibdelosporangium sp.]